MDFYMGNVFTKQRADLTPVYEFIFKKLKAKDLNWEYSFPRMGFVSFNREEDDDADEIQNYNPAEALQRQMKEQQKQDEINKLQQDFDKTYERASIGRRFVIKHLKKTSYKFIIISLR
ncbi:MAG: hypothetical protein ABJA79_02910 [Parafilimonas sp.]